MVQWSRGFLASAWLWRLHAQATRWGGQEGSGKSPLPGKVRRASLVLEGSASWEDGSKKGLANEVLQMALSTTRCCTKQDKVHTSPWLFWSTSSPLATSLELAAQACSSSQNLFPSTPWNFFLSAVVTSLC